MTYTADEFREAQRLWDQGIPNGGAISAALRIAARVAEPGVIEGALREGGVVTMGDYSIDEEPTAAAIRKALMEDKG